MTEEQPRPRPSRGGWRPLLTVVAAFLLLALGYGGIVAARRAMRPAAPEVTHAMVVEQLRAVARLVTSEATVRDVVIYESSWLGSTKRALVVATGKVTAGMRLDSATDVRIDHERRHIAVTLPPAEIFGVEVTNLRTYDERAGLWNPFRPADRDTIHQEVRAQLLKAGHEMGLLEHAEASARELLQALLARDGYTVEVTVAGGRPPMLDPR